MSDANDVEPVSNLPVQLRGSTTIAIISANIIVFALQLYAQYFHPAYPVDDVFALSLDGLRHGYIWQLLTYQFMHGGIAHILLNSWAIFVFGPIIETTLGPWRMLRLYFLSGAVGGLVQMVGTWLLPHLFGNAGVVGASAGAFGLVAAFAALYPKEQLYLLLLLIIPVRMRARTLLVISIAFAIFGIILPILIAHFPIFLKLESFVGNIAHAAHLGGLITGYVVTRQLIHQHAAIAPPVIHQPGVKSSLHIHPASD